MKILFLDFDGVITTYQSKWKISIEKLLLIDKIIQETNAKIVVTSSWKAGCETVNEFKEKIYNSSFSKEVKTEIVFKNFIDQLYDITDNNGAWRGDEIQRYIEKYKDEIESYVILDDDTDMLNEQLFNFVQTDGCEGICEREVNLSIKILNNEKIPNPIRLNSELKFKWMLNNYDKGTIIKLKDNNNVVKILRNYYNKK